jgi:hypothetical protein
MSAFTASLSFGAPIKSDFMLSIRLAIFEAAPPRAKKRAISDQLTEALQLHRKRPVSRGCGMSVILPGRGLAGKGAAISLSGSEPKQKASSFTRLWSSRHIEHAIVVFGFFLSFFFS